jgi:hypothetical protein
VRPSRRWETEDFGGSSRASLSSPDRPPRLSIHRPTFVREGVRHLATCGPRFEFNRSSLVPFASPRMRRLCRYTMCTRSPKPRVSPCGSCCLSVLSLAEDGRLGAVASLASRSLLREVANACRWSRPRGRVSPRFRIAEVRSVEWFSKPCVVRMLSWTPVSSLLRRGVDDRVLGNRRHFVAAIHSRNALCSGSARASYISRVISTYFLFFFLFDRSSREEEEEEEVVGVSRMIATWLILPVVICLSQRLSHACLSINCFIL